MKLHYFASAYGNFGDDLNPWLWDRVLPGAFDNDPSEHFVGIGTLLNHKLPPGPKSIFGAGMGYGDRPHVDKDWTIYFVRGPRTAEALSLDPSLALTDAAIFLTQVEDLPRVEKAYPMAFIPHHDSDWEGDWKYVCEQAGLRYIDPKLGPDEMLPELLKTEVLLCEAMHGAICADLLRVPWVPVACYDHIFPFKWLDWTESMALSYDPLKLSPIYDADRHENAVGRLKISIKRLMVRAGMELEGWFPPPRRENPEAEYEQAIQAMMRAMKTGVPRLSDDAVLENRSQRAMEKLDAFKKARGL